MAVASFTSPVMVGPVVSSTETIGTGDDRIDDPDWRHGRLYHVVYGRPCFETMIERGAETIHLYKLARADDGSCNERLSATLHCLASHKNIWRIIVVYVTIECYHVSSLSSLFSTGIVRLLRLLRIIASSIPETLPRLHVVLSFAVYRALLQENVRR